MIRRSWHRQPDLFTLLVRFQGNCRQYSWECGAFQSHQIAESVPPGTPDHASRSFLLGASWMTWPRSVPRSALHVGRHIRRGQFSCHMSSATTRTSVNVEFDRSYIVKYL